MPRLEVDVGRRRRRDRDRRRADPHAADVTDERGPLVQVGHVVRGVSGRVSDLEARRRSAAPRPPARSGSSWAPAASRPTAGPSRRRTAAWRCRRAGSGRPCGAHRARGRRPRSSGQRCTSEPLAPAWSRWMWVSSRARGRTSPSASSSTGRQDVGPGSISTSPTCQQPITRSRPRCMRSITRTAMNGLPARSQASVRSFVGRRRLVSRPSVPRRGSVGSVGLAARRARPLLQHPPSRQPRADSAERPAAAVARRRLVGSARETLRGVVGDRRELLGQFAGVVDDPVALDPDPVGIGVELLDPLVRRDDDLGRLDPRLLEPVLGFRRDWAVISSAVWWARCRIPEICSPTRSSARRTAASGERVACSSATSWLVCCT